MKLHIYFNIVIKLQTMSIIIRVWRYNWNELYSDDSCSDSEEIDDYNLAWSTYYSAKQYIAYIHVWSKEKANLLIFKWKDVSNSVRIEKHSSLLQ